MKKVLQHAKKLIAPALLLPMAASAQGNINALMIGIITTLNYILTIAFILLTLYFVWGVVQYVMSGGDEEKLAKGKQHMIWGIIGMAVAAGAWGIVQLILQYVIGGQQGLKPVIPQF